MLTVDGAARLVVPEGCHSTQEPSLNALANAAGDMMDAWQRQINRIALASTDEGMWAARNVVMSIPRQTGKTYDVEWIAIHRAATIPRIRIVWPAQLFSVLHLPF